MNKEITNKKEMFKCELGVYRIFWKTSAGGGSSVASIGQFHNGDRWIAPSNWVTGSKSGNPTTPLKEYASSIKSILLIDIQ